jgi:tRNA pseudouridine38-40 synthase
MRVFLRLSYKGTNFFGWQIQPEQISVQEAIEAELTKLNSGKEIKIVGCGRTDTGVHASEYFAHVDIPFEIDAKQLIFKLNNMLTYDVAVHEVIPVKKDAHARFDATSRTYHYFIHKTKDPFINDTSWFRPQDLDIDSMNRACLLMQSHTDFECFSKVKTDVTNFECDISHAAWVRSERGYIFKITANRFLRNMVRAIVGTLIGVGEGKLSLEEFQAILDSKNRSEAGQSVPAKGLFLAGIRYPYIE